MSHSVTQSVTYVGIELKGQLKKEKENRRNSFNNHILAMIYPFCNTLQQLWILYSVCFFSRDYLQSCMSEESYTLSPEPPHH